MEREQEQDVHSGKIRAKFKKDGKVKKIVRYDVDDEGTRIKHGLCFYRVDGDYSSAFAMGLYDEGRAAGTWICGHLRFEGQDADPDPDDRKRFWDGWFDGLESKRVHDLETPHWYRDDFERLCLEETRFLSSADELPSANAIKIFSEWGRSRRYVCERAIDVEEAKTMNFSELREVHRWEKKPRVLIELYASGTLHSTRRYDELERKTGVWTYYDAKEQVRCVESWKEGMQHGRWTFFVDCREPRLKSANHWHCGNTEDGPVVVRDYVRGTLLRSVRYDPETGFAKRCFFTLDRPLFARFDSAGELAELREFQKTKR